MLRRRQALRKAIKVAIIAESVRRLSRRTTISRSRG